ncbi:MAG: hydroxysqualene dehydroxylase HpnE [Acidimicrobiales bacterium]
MSGRSVVVVGGGLAGISAALAAADGGAGVTLLERRARLGGLTWSFQRKGLWFDNGQHVFLRCCTAYLALLARLGADDEVLLQRRLDLPVLAPRRPPSHLRRRDLPAPLHLLPSLAAYRHLPVADRLRLGRAAAALRGLDPDDPALDRTTFAGWLRRHGQSDRSIERLWGLIVLATVNLPAEEASLAMAAKVFRTGLLDRADAGDLGWSTVPLGRLHGDHAARALAASGVEVAIGTVVEAVRPEGDGWVVVAGDRRLRADSVVLATPPEQATRLAPAAGLAASAGLGHSPIVNVHLVLDRKVTDLPVAACVGSPVQFVFDRTSAAGSTRGQVLAVSLSAADRYLGCRPEALVATFAGALGDVFPVARTARVLDAVVTRERAATFRAVPGSGARRPGPVTTQPGLFVAGAWCATGWPATMEGAVRSGGAAAAAALGHLGSAGAPGDAEVPAAASAHPVGAPALEGVA